MKFSDAPRTIYVVQAVGHGLVKIGATDNLARRLRHLRNGSPVDLELVCTFPGTVTVERRIHASLLASHVRCEWFNPTPEVFAFIRSVLDSSFDAHALPPPKGVTSFVGGKAKIRHFIATYRPQDAAA